MTKVYLYALIPTEEMDQKELPAVKGFDEGNQLYTLPIEDITAVVCDLSGEAYTEAMIEEKINNDMPWLQRKAFHHHEVLTNLNQDYTIIPLKFCTIYSHSDRLKESIAPQKNAMQELFNLVGAHEEWNVKIYCDEEKLKALISDNSSLIEQKRQEIKKLAPGRQFFEKKKVDQLIEKELEQEQNHRCQQVHENLSRCVSHSDIKKNLGKDVTGLKENMSWNSVYLISKENVDKFLEVIKINEEEINVAGLRIEATGPWPAYHFSSFS